MKFSEQWLREWVNPNNSSEQLALQLTMLGLEVDTVLPAAADFTDVVVGQVIAREPHSNADRLSVCQVDVGQAQPLQIVCGASNVRAELKVAVALVGAILPGDFKIKPAKLRGTDSQGMICSARELGLSDEHEGILELLADAPVGKSFREYLSLDDYIIDIDITPNRGDCLSINGIAREIAALNELSITTPVMKPQPATVDDILPVKVTAVDACPRYVGRVIRDINGSAMTPLWMQERLRRSDMQCIHPVVDVMNYVMLELGQPLHAFDCDKLSGGIEVRFATANEALQLLDEKPVQCSLQTLVIADQQHAQAIAGVMGGLSSAVTTKTTSVFLESAFFRPDVVTRAARHFGLSTDASFRFERGVDFNLQMQAIERATELLLDVVGGQAGPVTEHVHDQALPSRQAITLRRDQVQRVLGVVIADTQAEQIFQALGMNVVKSNQHEWQVTAPSYRFDMAIEVDLIEELARLFGYANIPSAPLLGHLAVPDVPEQQISKTRIKQLLSDQGYHEAITYSFVDSQLEQMINPNDELIKLANPISQDMDVMRSSLWPGLLGALQYNVNRQSANVRLCEIGLCFSAQGQSYQQVVKLGLLASGAAHSLHWSQSERTLDFYDMKGDIEQLIALTKCESAFVWKAHEHPALHPGQCAALYYQDKQVGVLGALHPQYMERLGLTETPYLFEVELAAMSQQRLPKFEPISKFPSIKRDISLLLDQKITAQQILNVIDFCCGNLLNDARIFDIYHGEGIEKGKKSVALGLTFQEPSRTLVDEDVNRLMDQLINNLAKELNAKLRA